MRLLILVLSSLLTAALLGVSVVGGRRLDWNIGLHGWIALSLGVVFTIALAGALMAISFYSDRRGYDDRAHDAPGPAGASTVKPTQAAPEPSAGAAASEDR